ncbi:MAG: endonuclease NucS [archaeon]
MKIIQTPSLKESKKIIKNNIEKNNIILICNCKIDYKGRASSKIGWGERMIILKEDTTLMIHSYENRKPKNWNPSPTTTKVELNDNILKIINKRINKNETITIKINDIMMISSFNLSDDKELNLKETEEDLKKYIMKNPQSIKKDLKIIEEEKTTPFGDIDLYCKKDNKIIILELKRRTGGLNDVSQLNRYYNYINKNKNKKVEGILIAPDITNSAKNLLQMYGLKFKQMTPKGKG